VWLFDLDIAMKVSRAGSSVLGLLLAIVTMAADCRGGGGSPFGVRSDPRTATYQPRSLVGALAGVHSVAHDINERGEVVGVLGRSAARWVINERLRPIGPFTLRRPDGSDPGPGEARAVNNDGIIVGWLSESPVRPFVWNGIRELRELELPPGLRSGVAYDINDAGYVIGAASVDRDFIPDTGRIVRWRVDRAGGLLDVEDLGTFGGTGARAHGINELGEIVGVIWYSDGRPPSSFMWSEAAGLRTLPLGVEVLALNDRGEVVGGLSDRAVLWSGGSVQTIGPTGSVARGLSNTGRIVGDVASQTTEGVSRGFVLMDGELSFLEGLSTLDHTRGRSINDVGIIVGENYIPEADVVDASYWVRR
jgi:uncharacterized membrane protein